MTSGQKPGEGSSADVEEVISCANLGTWLSCIGRLEEAEAHLRYAFDVGNGNSLIAYNLIIVLMKKRRFADALALTRALSFPEELEPLARLQAGTCLLAMGQFREAMADLKVACLAQPDNIVAHFNLQRAAICCGERTVAAQAAATYEELLPRR